MADLKKYKVYENKRFEILSDSGFQDFKGIIIGENENKIQITFDNKTSIICTPKHKIMLNDVDYIYAKNLKIGDIIYDKKHVVNISTIKNDHKVYELLHVNKHKYFINGVLSKQCLLIDEAAHIDRYKEAEFVASVMPVISSSKKTKIFMISTSNGTSNHFYRTYTKAERGENGWSAEKIDWHEIPGRDEAWRKSAIADLGSEQAFNQEYGNMFIETGETAIDKDIIQEFRSIARKPDILNTPEYKVWEKPDPKQIYILGVDVSDGVGSAASTVQGLNLTDLTNIKQTCVYSNKFIDTTHFAKEIFDIAKQWGKPPIAIERNAMGGEVINILANEPFNYERLISYSYGQSIDYTKQGIYSSTNAKYEGVSNMRYWLNSLRAVSLFDIATIQELETFVKYPNGTWKHQPGDDVHDDLVMSLIWGLFGLHNGIVESFFEVLAYDEKGKPLKLAKNYYDDEKFYGVNQYRHDWNENEFVPGFISVKQGNILANQEKDDLMADGWVPFIQY